MSILVIRVAAKITIEMFVRFYTRLKFERAKNC